MAFDFYGVPDTLQLAVCADQECAAGDALERPTHEFLHAPDAVGLQHLVRRIAEQWKVEFLLYFETGEGFFRVGAGAQDRHAQFVELLFCVTKLGRFGRSTRRVGFWKEKEQHAFAAEIRQCQFAALVCFQEKVWSFITDLQHKITSGSQQFAQDVVDGLRIGLAARGAHDLADEKLEDAFVAGAELGDVVGIFLDDFAGSLFDF